MLHAFEWTLPIKYVNYIQACIHTLLVGKRHRVVHYADAQLHLRHAAISRVQNSKIFPYFANQNVSERALCAIYIHFFLFTARLFTFLQNSC